MNPYEVSEEIVQAELNEEIITAEMVDEGDTWPVIAVGIALLVAYIAGVSAFEYFF